MTHKAPLLELNQVKIVRSSKIILDQLSFHINPGEILAIIGPNGVGKTSLLEALLGAVVFKGKINVDHQCLRSLPARQRATLVSAVLQSTDCALPISIQQFLEYSHYSSKQNFEVVKLLELCESLGAKTDLSLLMSQISGGERQLYQIITALLQDTPLVLLDEAFRSLDYATCSRVMQKLVELKTKAAKSFILVTHDLNRAMLLADKILLLYEGKQAFIGSAAEFTNCALYKDLYRNFAFPVAGPEGLKMLLPEIGT